MTALVLVPATQQDMQSMPPPLRAGIAGGFDGTQDAGAELRSVFAQFEQVARPAEWGQFWSHDLTRDRYVGLVGFKAPPRHNAVEIAYFTFPGFEGHGFATSAIQHLADHAGEAGMEVVAHTLPDESASTSALKRCGFAYAGEVLDPEDGPVWRWVREIA